MKFVCAAFCLLTLSLISNFSSAQASKDIISGPMLGQVELRTAKIWVEVKPGSQLELHYWKKGNMTAARKLTETISAKSWFAPIVFNLVALEMNTTYEYQVITGKGVLKPFRADGQFTTKELWQYRKPAPDFSFLAGSCFYVNEPIYDRPQPYGMDSSIFQPMAKEKAAFMLWLGDNWYTRESDFFDDWGLWYRASHDRSLPILQNFLKAMSHYATWDDHDYGPNNADGSYHLKETSRRVFASYWANPSYGEDGEGVYTKLSYGDVDLFLLDDRSFRSADFMEAIINGKPNPEKRMFGEKQMTWLKNALINSYAPFKIVVAGSQVLNVASTQDCLKDYPIEFDELLAFLETEKIQGVLFMSGDRHHSEVIRYQRSNSYALYDVTTSPLTAGIAAVREPEKSNPERMPGTLVEAQNYSRISISGKPKERKLKVEFLGIKGDKLGEWEIDENQLRYPIKN
ncbi:MAG TPA: alkaline phosphatase D family protein [Flavitalea sp.]|nr:alkaline phosphatase D family protein [Flavitalea sp.]